MKTKKEIIWIGDLEGDGLKYEITTVHCMVFYDISTGVYHISVSSEWVEEIREFNGMGIRSGLPTDGITWTLYRSHTELINKVKDQADKIIFHNGINFDFPAIKKVLGVHIPDNKQGDTFILSSLYNPDRPRPKGCKGPHSIKAWGKKFGTEKPTHKDWSKFSISMLYRCIEDVKIGTQTYLHLKEKMDKWGRWEESIRLEYATARYHAQQELNGCPFNKIYAWRVFNQIKIEMWGLSDILLERIPKKIKLEYKDPLRKPFKANGEYSVNLLKWFNHEEANRIGVSGPFTRINWVEIELDSDKQIKEYLFTQGWMPKKWNYKKDKSGRVIYDNTRQKIKTSPKLTEDSYKSIKGDTGKLVARYNILKHRRGLLKSKKNPTTKGLLNLIRDDGCIPAEGVPQAAVTGRYRHSKIVNIPKAKSDKVTGELIYYPAKQKIPFGTEFRSMFWCPDSDYVMVGVDAKGLEARMEAHYCYKFKGGEEYAHDLIDGDIHTKVMKMFEIDDRDIAKNGKYCLTYGGQIERLAETINMSKKQAKKSFNNFWNNNTALKGFRDACERAYEQRGGKGGGYLVGLDGRKLRIRSKHALVNTVFQSAGNIIVKTACCFLWNRWIPKSGIDARLIIHQHDEFQAIVHKKNLEVYKEFALEALPMAGRYFKLNVPTPGDVKYGRSWSETH